MVEEEKEGEVVVVVVAVVVVAAAVVATIEQSRIMGNQGSTVPPSISGTPNLLKAE